MGTGTGLHRIGIELAWIGLGVDCTGLGLDWPGLGLDCTGLGLDWPGLDWEWIALERPVHLVKADIEFIESIDFIDLLASVCNPLPGKPRPVQSQSGGVQSQPRPGRFSPSPSPVQSSPGQARPVQSSP